MENRMTLLAKEISPLLENKLPGKRAHKKMIPEVRRTFGMSKKKRVAAVMILLFPKEGYINIALIQRTRYDGDHSGQISLPGGIKELSDRDLLHTSVRETAEETGVPARDIKIIGKLSPIYIPVSAFRVQPFVAYLEYAPRFKPDPVEVDYLILVPVLHFLNNHNRKIEKWNLSGRDIKVPFFSFQGYKIWGATAMILSEFIDIIEAVEPDLWFHRYSDSDYNDK